MPWRLQNLKRSLPGGFYFQLNIKSEGYRMSVLSSNLYTKENGSFWAPHSPAAECLQRGIEMAGVSKSKWYVWLPLCRLCCSFLCLSVGRFTCGAAWGRAFAGVVEIFAVVLLWGRRKCAVLLGLCMASFQSNKTQWSCVCGLPGVKPQSENFRGVKEPGD